MTRIVFILLCVALLNCAIMGFAAAAQRVTGKSGWADAFWTFGVGVSGAIFALAALASGEGPPARGLLVAVMVFFWAARLCVHIARRAIKGPDDPRYAALRREWGEAAARKMFWFLQTQAFFAVFLALSVWAAAANPRPGLDPRDYAGALLLVIAVIGEGAADRAVRNFGRDPANQGRICDIGLWRWSRHPNYFFEWLGWLAYPIIAIDFSGSYLWGWFALTAPAAMYWLLVHVSGLPPLEKHMLESRGAAFRAYRDRTSAFFPWPPKSV
ncbi:protein of unknown function DUF1295 [Methylocella silvestris BL2]|uniref:Uncharacterized protein n=1 Tax=Methylocella silvestris (strain DSM 15510 / CIP 108128 / LMG 27833 / NCIMB 13906 / BL2) TaxID=395965 RepID=B8EPW3_METSB|nr:DUF1295 domain-containing protein [Methylocella silvestris]ACK50967.1 protein of unknown function DUF1295 [Methylocella silvestris BL2]